MLLFCPVSLSLYDIILNVEIFVMPNNLQFEFKEIGNMVPLQKKYKRDLLK